jgi:APAF-1 helical domain
MRVLVIHDVIRDWALTRLGPAGTASAHAALLTAARAALPPGEDGAAAWWRLPDTPGSGYLLAYLTYHLKAAGLSEELDRVCGDLRFLAVRLVRSGPAAVEADLARSDSSAAGRLRRVVAQNAYLLGPAEPTDALITTFTSRLGVGEQASHLAMEDICGDHRQVLRPRQVHLARVAVQGLRGEPVAGAAGSGENSDAHDVNSRKPNNCWLYREVSKCFASAAARISVDQIDARSSRCIRPLRFHASCASAPPGRRLRPSATGRFRP